MPSKERLPRVDVDPQVLVAAAPEVPVPLERREDHARHHDTDDDDAGVHVVRQRTEEDQEGGWKDGWQPCHDR